MVSHVGVCQKKNESDEVVKLIEGKLGTADKLTEIGLIINERLFALSRVFSHFHSNPWMYCC